MLKSTSSKSVKKRMKILNHLLEEGDVNQQTFQNIFPPNLAYTTIIRHLQSLEYFGLIQLTQQVRGKQKREWRLTTLGLVSCFIKKDNAFKNISNISAKHTMLLPLLFGKWTFYEQIGVVNTIKHNLENNVDRLKEEFEPIIDNALNMTLHEINQGKKMRENMTHTESIIMEKMIKYLNKDFPKYLESEILNHSFGLSQLSRIYESDKIILSLSKIMKDEDLKKYISEYLKESLVFYHESYSNIRNWYERLCVE